MGSRAAVMLSALLLLAAWLAAAEERSPFMLERSEQVVKTKAGEVRVVRGAGPASGGAPISPLHIGFISMEPKTLFIPQYWGSSFLLFVKGGKARVGWIDEDDLVEQQLKMGDIIRIPAGSTFYIINTSEGQRLHIICGIDTSESLDLDPYQSFFIGGGQNPRSVLAGFDKGTLSAALNVTEEKLRSILGSQTVGPFVPWTGAGGLKNKKKRGLIRSPDPYNLFDRKPDFKNRYGWTVALDEHDYPPLKNSNVGVYIVNLTAGSMMAPHVNMGATEYGVVIDGLGTVQVVYPKGTSTMSAAVAEGDVFLIPSSFPFSQISSSSGPLVFFGFTSSAKGDKPQFLAGRSSLLRKMMGPELAAGFGVAEEELREILEAQREDVFLPSQPPHAREG